MKQFNAWAVFFSGESIGRYAESFGSGIKQKGPNVRLTQSWATDLKKHLKQYREFCKFFGLPAAEESCIELQGHLRKENFPYASLIEPLLTEMGKRMRAELKAHVYLYVSRDSAPFLQQPFAKWEEARKAFPSTEYDIREAGNCLALGRATACVFHVMRVLEGGLCALAKKFDVPFEHKAWGEIINRIEKEIRQINQRSEKPRGWKDDEQFYSEAASQFMHFKNAWRNYTAHRQFKYTEEEAEAVYRHVRDFMKHLAERLKEEPI
jgi:hypothetical protein